MAGLARIRAHLGDGPSAGLSLMLDTDTNGEVPACIEILDPSTSAHPDEVESTIADRAAASTVYVLYDQDADQGVYLYHSAGRDAGA